MIMYPFQAPSDPSELTGLGTPVCICSLHVFLLHDASIGHRSSSLGPEYARCECLELFFELFFELFGRISWWCSCCPWKPNSPPSFSYLRLAPKPSSITDEQVYGVSQTSQGHQQSKCGSCSRRSGGCLINCSSPLLTRFPSL